MTTKLIGFLQSLSKIFNHLWFVKEAQELFQSKINLTIQSRDVDYAIFNQLKWNTSEIKTYFIPFYDDELKQQYYVVQLEQELAKGTAELEIEWTGDLTGTLVGINKVTYTDGGK